MDVRKVIPISKRLYEAGKRGNHRTRPVVALIHDDATGSYVAGVLDDSGTLVPITLWGPAAYVRAVA